MEDVTRRKAGRPPGSKSFAKSPKERFKSKRDRVAYEKAEEAKKKAEARAAKEAEKQATKEEVVKPKIPLWQLAENRVRQILEADDPLLWIRAASMLRSVDDARISHIEVERRRLNNKLLAAQADLAAHEVSIKTGKGAEVLDLANCYDPSQEGEAAPVRVEDTPPC